MDIYGIKVAPGHISSLDPDFAPLGLFRREYLREAPVPVAVALERADGQTAVERTFLRGTAASRQADLYHIDRLVKTMLWTYGGFRVRVSGDRGVFEYLAAAYAPGGSRAFDRDFMSGVYQRPFEVVWSDAVPAPSDRPQSVGGHLTGCRIGFDAGGSDRKVSAVMDGATVYSEEVVWHPKLHADPRYHYDGIVAALRSAAAHLPRVDAVGVSSAGVIINDRPMNASLFIQVPREDQDRYVRDIFIRAIRDTFGDIPYRVINDGDVSALAGAMSLGENNVLGIAMGTSEAAGYVDREGRITGWLNELAFVPVDANPAAMADEWSGDIGCGVKYFSQDAVIRLAPRAGLPLDPALSPAEKLKAVQSLAEAGDSRAAAVFDTIGIYLGHTLPAYYQRYACRHVLLLGRVMSGRGGDIILATAQNVLKEEYPELADKVLLELPNETFRRLGQSVAAASLPEIGGTSCS